MKIARCLLPPLVVLFISAGSFDVADADVDRLLKQVPASANSLVLIKSSDIAANASGATRQQIKDHLDAAKAWPIISAWKPQRIVIASELDIQHMAPSWGMAAIEFELAPDIEEIAKKTNGIVDHVAGQDVVWLENACVLVNGEKQLTIVSPLNRQSAANWLRRIKAQDAIALSSYLAEVAGSFESGDSEILVAIDLGYVFGPAQIAKAVANSPIFKQIDSNPTEIIASVRGLAIRCQIDANQDSSINIDFGKPIEPLKPIARELMIGALTKAGAMLGEFDDWKSETADKHVGLRGQLSSGGLRKILGISSIGSIVANAESQVDHEAKPDPATRQVPKVDPAEQARLQATIDRQEQARNLAATKAYFGRVMNSLNDVFDNQDQNSLEQAALWINNNARSIDRLSTRNVDPEMVKFGKYAAASLSSIVGQFHQSDTSRRNRTAAVVPSRGNAVVTAVPYQRVNYGGNIRYRYAPMVSGNLDVGSGVRERREIRADEVNNANQIAWSIKAEIDEETAYIRQLMTKKYGVEF